jgi:hypothetical protein
MLIKIKEYDMSSFRFNCFEGLKRHGFRELKKSLPSFRPYLLSEYNDKFLTSNYGDYKEFNQLVYIYYNREFKVYATCDAVHGTIVLEAKNRQDKGYINVWEFNDHNWLFSNGTDDMIRTCEHGGSGCGCYTTNLLWVLSYITGEYPIPTEAIYNMLTQRRASKTVVKFDRSKYMIIDGRLLMNR